MRPSYSRSGLPRALPLIPALLFVAYRCAPSERRSNGIKWYTTNSRKSTAATCCAGGRCSSQLRAGCTAEAPTPAPTPGEICAAAPASRLLVSSVTAATFSEERPVHAALFGPPRAGLVALPGELDPGQHPRILTGRAAWRSILASYADPARLSTPGTWAHFFYGLSFRLGPQSSFVRGMAELEVNGTTKAYQARPYVRDSADYETYRRSLEPLASRLPLAFVGATDGFVVCTLWASVARLQREMMQEAPLLGEDGVSLCVNAAVGWAKVTLAHRTYHCNPACPTKANNNDRADIWNIHARWSLHHDWFTGGTGLAFTYDYLFEDMNTAQRRVVRSAIAMSVFGRHVWGANDVSDASSPNIFDHPHRAFSNWGGYNSNLYIANLAIEGEDDFDAYSAAVLDIQGSSGFNEEVNFRYEAVLTQFMLHSFYPDGSTFEDGYSYFHALREGSLGLLALHRRGSANVLESPRFRNIIHNAAQMFEPWQCGQLIGHASGGGNLYNAYVGLFKYVYPEGELPGMLWRQRFGDYRNRPCRSSWVQSVMQLAFLGGEHSSNADSPGSLDTMLRHHFKLSYYASRRGLLVARSHLSSEAVYIHFDARPDAFLVGHDNADRGVFTFSALRQTWIDDLPWKQNTDSRKHSLLHIDGLAQAVRAPSVRMLKVLDNGRIVVAAADLTYAYNWQWSPSGSSKTPSWQRVLVYDDNGDSSHDLVYFDTKEEIDPWSLGWPEDDRGKDIGFTDTMTLHGVDDIGFAGLNHWKRPYRAGNEIRHIVRSVALVRNQGDELGFLVVADSAAASLGREHVFESYLILEKSIRVNDENSSCKREGCRIVLQGKDRAYVDIHVSTLGINPSYRTESFDGYQRLIVKSVRRNEEEFWIVIHPHRGETGSFSTALHHEGTFEVENTDGRQFFSVRKTEHSIVPTNAPEPSGEVETTATPNGFDSEANSLTPSKSPYSTTTAPPHVPMASGLEVSSIVLPSTEEQEDILQSLAPESLPSVTPIPSGSTPSASGLPLFSLTVIPAQSSSPSLSSEVSSLLNPMNPIRLAFGRSRKVRSFDMLASPERYLKSSPADLRQVVFSFMSHSIPETGMIESFTTCFGRTNVETSLMVYDCGATMPDINYNNRNCIPVSSQDDEQSCPSESNGSLLRVALERWRRYFLVVSVLGGKIQRPRLVILHDVIKGGPKSMPDTATIEGPPPLPQPLRLRKSQVYNTSAMQASGEKRFHRTHAKYQMVFQVVGAAGAGQSDVFGTCYKKTTVAVAMTTYDCGFGSNATQNYSDRNCTLLARSTGRDRCGKFKTKFKASLERSRSYFLIVDVMEWPGKNPLIAIYHKVFDE